MLEKRELQWRGAKMPNLDLLSTGGVCFGSDADLYSNSNGMSQDEVHLVRTRWWLRG